VSGAVVHVVRDYGGLTEPFIEQRIGVGSNGSAPELWFERASGDTPATARRVVAYGLAPGSLGDRLFHRIPQIGPALARNYTLAEREVAPGLIHAHYATTGYLVGSVTRSPLVVGTYGFDVSTMARNPLWARAFRQLATRADRVVVEGPHMLGVVVRLGFATDRIRIVPIPVDISGDVPPQPTQVAGPWRLLTCGRFVEKKGHELAIRAFAEVRSQLPAGSTLEIVGSGPLEQRLRAVAASMAVTDVVLWPGVLPRVAFRDRLASATLFLAPSVTAANGDAEGGAPTTILDAQSVGTIVIGSTHADIPFLVEEGSTGYLAVEGDASSLAEAVRRALDGGNSWPGIRERAREQVLARHAPAVVAQGLRDVYREILG